MYLLGLFNKGLGFYAWATHHEDFVYFPEVTNQFDPCEVLDDL